MKSIKNKIFKIIQPDVYKRQMLVLPRAGEYEIYQPVKVAELVSDVPKCNGCCTRVPSYCFEVHMELIMRLWD